MKFATIILIATACYGQVTVKYSLQPSGVFRALAGRRLPSRTALYEAVACADADSLLDEGRLLASAPFSTVSQARAITLEASRSRAALAWRVASVALPLALAGAGAAGLDLSVLAPLGGGVALTTLVNAERARREAVPSVGPFVGSDVLVLGAGRCVTRLMLGQYPPPKGIDMPVLVTIQTAVQPSSQGRNLGEGRTLPAVSPLAAGSPATFEISRTTWEEIAR